MKKTFVVLLAASLIALQPAWANNAPEVSNVQAQQRPETGLVDITYDVYEPDGDRVAISVQVSNDGGLSYTIFPQSLSGDVGEEISAGTGKRIVWDAGQDIAGMWSPFFRVRVTADDGGGPAPPPGMVLVPAGEFIMGDNAGNSNEMPEHTVYLDAFYIDQYEVTFRQYAEVKLLSRLGGSSGSGNGDDYPVTRVSWNDAKTYCEWLGKRLPTEAEWEKAARGSGGRKYPWGNENYNEGGISRANHGTDSTTPVGSFPQGVSPYGAYDMAGNVWEWVADWYSEGYFYNSPYRNPKGPDTSDRKIFRGGSYYLYDASSADALRVSYRTPYFYHSYTYHALPGLESDDVGFRCAKDPK